MTAVALVFIAAMYVHHLGVVIKAYLAVCFLGHCLCVLAFARICDNHLTKVAVLIQVKFPFLVALGATVFEDKRIVASHRHQIHLALFTIGIF
jgi:hypothetical protein